MSEDDAWRSEAAYNYVDTLSPGDLAWEFLRRNIEYKRSYDEFLQRSEKSEEVTREFTSRWEKIPFSTLRLSLTTSSEHIPLSSLSRRYCACRSAARGSTQRLMTIAECSRPLSCSTSSHRIA